MIAGRADKVLYYSVYKIEKNSIGLQRPPQLHYYLQQQQQQHYQELIANVVTDFYLKS